VDGHRQQVREGQAGTKEVTREEVNRLQRECVIRESGFRCPILGIEYLPRVYFEMEDTLPPFLRLTVDHCDGRFNEDGVKADEESDNVSCLSGEAHWFKDNASRDAQMAWLKRKIAEENRCARPESARVALMTANLRKLESGMTLRDIVREIIDARGPLSAAYEAAKEQEYAVDAPSRAAKKKASRHAQYERDKKKAGGSRLSKPKTPKGPQQNLPKKVLDQQARRVLNYFPE
jgi:hypothetical protein